MPADQSTDERSGVVEYVHDGPDAGGNSILRRSLGFLLWWRVWATGLVFAGSLALILSITPAQPGPMRAMDPHFYALIGWFTGLFTASVIELVIWRD